MVASVSVARLRTLVGLVLVVLVCSLLAPVGVVLAAGAQPQASLSVPATGLIGEPLSFSVSFDNTDTTNPGYGPYIDLVLPAAGTDGAGGATDDGITFTSASYLGTQLVPVIPPFICTGGTFNHPLTGLPTACTNDTQVVVLQLPFGSFTATQPPAAIQVKADVSKLADVNVAMSISAVAGFAYGNTPLIDPATDPPIVQSPGVSASYTPQLFTLTKIYLGPEDETATGPNFPRQYRITVNIADGQTLTNLDLTDVLPNNMQFVSMDQTAIRGTTTATSSSSTPSTTVPGGTLTRRFASVTGTTAADDATMLFTFYIPRLDSTSAIIVPVITGDDVTSLNNARTQGNWTPIDTRDAASTPSIDPVGPEHTLTDKSIAIQKGVTNITDSRNSPGDTLQYTLDIQVSDFFAFDGIVVNDTFSDGQHWDPSFVPTLTVNGNTFVLPVTDIAAANYTVDASQIGNDLNPATNGTTSVQFRLSDEMITRSAATNGRMVGGCVFANGTGLTPVCLPGNAGDGPTTAKITFRTKILDKFTDTYPSGEPNVDEGDILNNNVTVSGNVLNNVGLTRNGNTEDDDSRASVQISRGDLAKTIYAVNNVVCATQPCANVAIQPGDRVTYRLERELLTTDVENLQLIDYLPLPIFDVDDENAPVVSKISTFDPTVSNVPPPAGTAKFGPSDTFYAKAGIVPFNPATAIDSVANSVTFDYGSFSDPNNLSAKIDLLFTVTANSAPFADGLFLTNQLREQTESTNNGTQIVDAIVQLKVFEPDVYLVKGVVATDAASPIFSPSSVGPVPFNAPGTVGARFTGTVNSTNLLASPINSDLANVDAGDRVSFAIVLENRGTAAQGQFDARVRDTLPAGFAVPSTGAGLNLRVVDGTGAVINTTNIGTGLFDPTGGIELQDPGPTATPTGALDPGKNPDGTTRNDGRNIAIITYDLVVQGSVGPNQALVNTATLYNYSSLEGGQDHTVIDRSDPATVTTAPPTQVKTLVTTSETHTTGSNVTIGEIVRYRLASRLPEGTYTGGLVFQDRLPPGLTFLNDGSAKVAFVSNGGGITSSTLSGAGLTVPGNDASLGATPSSSIAFALPDPAVSKSASTNDDSYATGDDVYFKLGNITNADNDADAEFVVVEFNALVDNTTVGSNDFGDTLNNDYLVLLNGTQVGLPAPTVAATVVEPQITNLAKIRVSTGNPDAGDTQSYRLTYSNANTASSSDAFEVRIVDTLPALLNNLSNVVVRRNGTVIASGFTNNSTATQLDVTVAQVAKGDAIQIDYDAVIQIAIAPNQTVTNTANLTYTSLPGTGTVGGTNTTGSSTPGASGATTGERNGSGTAPNDYTGTSSASFTAQVPALTKSLVTTSEVFTTDPRVAVGEIVRYRLVAQLPEATYAPGLSLFDALSSGLTFLNDGTAKVAFVSNGGISSSTLSGAGLNVSTLPAPNALTFVLPDAAVSKNATSNDDSYGTGNNIYFKLGDVVNSDNDADAEYVVVEFNALVDNTATGSNDAGDTRNNNFQTRINNVQVGATSASVQVTIAEPLITTAKTIVTPAGKQADAGDTVDYRVTLNAANGVNNTDAFNVQVRDPLPAGLTLISGPVVKRGATTLTAGVDYTNATAGNTIDITINTVFKNDTVTIEYSASVGSGVTPGQTATNTATTRYTSLPGTNGTTGNATGSNTPGASGADTGERNGSGTPSHNDLTSNASDTLTVFAPAPVKSLVATSEPASSGANLLIGEVARYRLVTRVPEGSSPNFYLRENLPAGLTFLNDGTAKAALVSDDVALGPGNGLTSNTLGVPFKVAGNETTTIPSSALVTLPDSAISDNATTNSDTYASGSDVFFKFGDLGNNDSDANQELVIVEFNAIADNSVTNVAGATHVNNVSVFVNNGATPYATSNDVTTTVLVPSVSVVKSIIAAPLDGGNTIIYRLVVSNASGATRGTAYDLDITDALDNDLTFNSFSASFGAATVGADPVAQSVSKSGNVYSVTRLDPGQDVTIDITATVNGTVSAGETFTNQATHVSTTLPGSGTALGANNTTGSTAGTAGSATGERTGAGGVNSLSGSSNTVSSTMPDPTVTKLALTQTDYPIGATVTYYLDVTLPEGVTEGLVVNDLVPNGLTAQSYEIITSGSTSGVTPATTVAWTGSGLTAGTTTLSGYTDGQDINISLGNVTTASNNAGADNTFLVKIVAQVSNVAGNQNSPQTTLTNTANLSFTRPATNATSNPNTGGTTVTTPNSSTAIKVVEPVLTFSKTLITAGTDGGDAVQYRVRVTNASGATISTAYEIRLLDTLNANLAYVSASTSLGTLTDSTVGQNVDLTLNQLAPGATADILINATVRSSAPSGSTIGNSVSGSYTSLGGTVTGERTGAGGVNDYTGSDGSPSFTLATPTIDKQNPSLATAPIGQQFTYDIRVTLPEGLNRNLVVNDVLPAGLRLDSYVVDTTDYAGGTPPTPTVSPALPAAGAGTVAFTFGDTTNTPDGNSTNNTFILRVTATVQNITGNQAGVTRSNTASLTYTDGTNGNSTVSDPSAPTAVTVIEPQPTLAKGVQSGQAVSGLQAGDTVKYRVFVTNPTVTNSATAFDSVITDIAPSGLLITSIDTVNLTGGATADSAVAITGGGTGFSGTYDMPQGSTVEVLYTATVQTSVTPGQVLTNNAGLTFTSLNGTSADERTGADGPGGALNDYAIGRTQDVSASTSFSLTKSSNKTTATIGEEITYTLTVTVIEGTTNNVQIRDTLPTGLQLVAGSVTVAPSGGVSTGYVDEATSVNATGNPVIFSLGTVVNPAGGGNSVTLTYKAVVLNTAATNAADVKTNSATASGTGVTTTPAQTTSTTLVEPNLTISKSVTPAAVDVGGEATYTIVVSNPAGGVMAHDVVVTDSVPTRLDYVAGSIGFTSGSGTTSVAAGPPTVLTWNIASIPAGGSVTLTFKATLNSTGVQTAVINNTATTTWTSTPGANPNERNGSGGVNDYTATSNAAPLVRGGTLGDRVWLDQNGNGAQDPGEAGIPGVVVQLVWAGPDNIFGNGDDVSYPNKVTDASGGYTFTTLPNGNYRATIDITTLPPNVSQTYDLDGLGSLNTTDTTLTINQSRTDVDFGYRGTASLGDRVWIDANGDGVQDAGEPGLPGVGVTLTYYGRDGVSGGNDDFTLSTTADASGNYSFTNLPSGNFQVDVVAATLPSNVSQTYDLDGTATANRALRTLGAGDAATDVDFGYRGTASIGDTVWYDADGSATQNNNEPGIAGATVTLVWGGPDGDLATAADNVTFTATTNASGGYLFPGLPVNGASDPYRVTVTPPAAYTAQTYDSDGLGTASQSTLNLGATENNTAQDFGYRAAATQSLGNFVWDDLNGNGVQDTGEPGIGSVTVRLLDSGGTNVLAITTTAADGSYSFPSLVPGDYQVEFVLPSGYARTTANSSVSTELTDSDALASGLSGVVTVPAGANNLDVDAGFYKLVTLGDRVWYDVNADGVQTGSEPGISGATVTVVWLGPDGAVGGGDDQTFTTTTGANGAWSIGNVPPGSYQITASGLPAGLTTVTDSVDNGALNAANPVIVSTTSGVNRTDLDFGFRGTASLGDRVWRDNNGDGVQDASEGGVAGATVTVTWFGQDGALGGGDDVTLSTATNASGFYSFINLPAGNYRVAVDPATLPSGLTQTYDLDGTATADVALTTLTAVQNRTDVDFGYRDSTATASLGDRVWRDTNGNGVQDAGEPGISGVPVTLVSAGLDGVFGTADDTTSAPQPTAADGAYSFTNLPAGSYRVVIDTTSPALSGLVETYERDGTLDASTTVGLTVGQNVTDVDFGFTPITSGAQRGSVGDRFWNDANGNGLQDTGESGIGGVSLTLRFAGPDGIFGNADDVTATTVTAADGSYSFGNLPAGSYRLTVDAASLPGTASQTYELDGSRNGDVSFTLGAGQNRTDLDFGYILDLPPTVYTGGLGDLVWFDTNGNGAQDAGENGIAGVTVTAVGPGGITFSTVTDASGVWDIVGVPDGSYTITVDASTLPSGLAPSYDLDGTGTANSTVATVTGGVVRKDVDFGYTGAGSIGDRVWNDANANGLQELSEVGFSGVPVTLVWGGPDNDLTTAADNVTYTTTTGVDGAYTFGGLPQGVFRVTVTTGGPLAGYTQTYDLDGTGSASSSTLTLAPGQNRSDADFGYTNAAFTPGTASIGDLLWLDKNADGVRDAGEPGLAGVTVNVTGPGGVSYTTVTDSTGGYSFGSLPAGSYTVTVDVGSLPPGLRATFEQDGTLNNGVTVTLAAGAARTDLDFGYTGTGSLGDRVWQDVNGDGVQQPGEPGIAGVTITLTGTGPDGYFGTADDIAYGTRTTDSNGIYLFNDLPAGQYRAVTSSVPAGFLPTFELDGTLDGTTFAGLTAGQNRRDVDFGYRNPSPPATGTIGDQLWVDANGDGVKQPSETGLDGVTVRLSTAGPDGVFGTADDVVVTTVTSGGGLYAFPNLADGGYRVQVDASTLPANLTASYDRDGAADNRTDVNLTGGATISDADFGYQPTNAALTASLGDRVWNDTDGDGVQDAGETGIGGVKLTVTFAGPDGDLTTAADNVTYTVTTAADGSYNLSGLPAGTYRVQVDGTTVPAGLTQSYELDGSRNGDLTVALAAGQSRTDVDFGYTSAALPPASGSIGDRVWYDLDGNGAQDAGETGLTGVTVQLSYAGPDGIFGTADDLTYTQVTGADGAYNFTGLADGSYAVSIVTSTLPAGLTPTADRDGLATLNSADVALSGGAAITDADFGYTGAGSIGDRVWNDANGDRIQQPSEVGIGGVTVTLTSPGADGILGTADDPSRTTVTDAAGFYLFSGLPAGDYRVSLTASTIPAGLSETYELDGTLNGSSAASLAPGQSRRDVDFGYSASPVAASGSIGDRVWFDLDGDGAQDPGEPGIPGVTVSLIAAGVDGLFGTADDVIYTQVTGADGAYGFTSLPAGSYRVVVDPADAPAGTTITGERDATRDGRTDISLGAGQAVSDADFGYRGVGSIGDLVYYDRDADKTQDTGEPGIPNVPVTITWYGPDGAPGGGDDVTFTATTDASGAYLAVGLPLGSYGVTAGATLPGGWVNTVDADSIANGSSVVTLTPATPNTRVVDFGYTGTGSISQHVWLDADRDGVVDAAETGLTNVLVTLTWAGPDGVFGTADDVVTTTRTDANGDYQFINLPAGPYKVAIDTSTVPSELVPTYDRDGGNDSLINLNLGAAQNIPDVNFGYALNPTAVTLTSFTAVRSAEGVVVSWVTSAEVNTWGFHVLRSTSADRATAQRVTAALIPHAGRGQGGASYRWVDTSAEPGVTYTYWLEETEINGTTNIYGPTRLVVDPATLPFRITLPMLHR